MSRVIRTSALLLAMLALTFMSGTSVRIRMGLVARGTRRDEDGGRSAFTSFKVRALS